MNDQDVLKVIALALTPSLLTVIGFFLRSTLVKLAATVNTLDKDFVGMKKDIQMLSEMMSSLKHIHDEWYSMKREVSQMVVEMKGLKSSLEDVVILKRDHQTMWKRIDEIRQDVKEGLRS